MEVADSGYSHTSGSTGLPKPLIWTQETAARHIEAGSRESPNGLVSIDSFFHGKRVLSTLPPFHVCFTQPSRCYSIFHER